MALGTGLGITKILANTDVRTPDHPVYNESLSQLPSCLCATSEILINNGQFSTFNNLYGRPLQTCTLVVTPMCQTKKPRLIEILLSPAVWLHVSNMKTNFLRKFYIHFHVLLFPKLWCCLPNYTTSYSTRCQSHVLRRRRVRTILLMQRDRSVICIAYSGRSAGISQCTATITDIMSSLIKFQSYSKYNIRKLQVTVCVFV
jgi:hypothetical protein